MANDIFKNPLWNIKKVETGGGGKSKKKFQYSY